MTTTEKKTAIEALSTDGLGLFNTLCGAKIYNNSTTLDESSACYDDISTLATEINGDSDEDIASLNEVLPQGRQLSQRPC